VRTDSIKVSEMVYALMLLVVAVLYYWSAQLGFIFSWNHTNVSAVWPPSALSFIVIYYLGYRLWPAIWLGAFLVNIGYFLSNPSFNIIQNILLSLPIATGNTLEALVICFFLKKLIGGNNPLHKVHDILSFMLIAMMGCAMAATMGSVTVCLSNSSFWSSFPLIWFTWWMGDFSGLLTLTPVFWALGQRSFPRRDPKLFIEFIISMSVLVLVNSMLFDGTTMISQMHVPVTYLPLALMVWLTYRFGYWGAIMSILVTLYQAIQGTNNGFGPFITADKNGSLLLLQTFIGTVCGTTLLLAATLYERRQAQQEMNLSEKRFRALVENSMDMIALLNPLGVISYSSPSAEKIMGFTRFEHEGHSIFEFIHPDDEAYIMGEFSRLLTNPKEKVSATMRVRHKNGSWRWIESYGQNLLQDPVIGAIVVNYRDITDRKKSQERFHQAVESAPSAMMMFDEYGSIQLVNKASEVLWGYSRKELLQMRIENLLPERLRAKFILYRQSFSQETAFKTTEAPKDLFGLRKDGHEAPIEIGLNPIDIEGKKFVLASILDITERRLAEDVLKRDKNALEKLVEERSKELIQVQNALKQASRLADIGTLAAIVAHELRTPLGVIQMAVHNFKNKHKEFVKDNHLENIEKKVWEGNRIIDNLLSYSSIKAPSMEPCMILNLLDECLSNLGNLFHDFQVTVNKNYEVNHDFVIDLDPHQIREVFINILNNAYQALPNKTGSIDIRVAKESNNMLQISIKDNGGGIDAVDLDKIFLPFFTTKAKGTGLGLSICNEIINFHQGHLSVQSTKGEGTTIFISLPIKNLA
jgi:PAS domain S-box-containing protein